ncbi:MAG: TolC family protein [Luteolibacter sp.]
MLSTPLRGALAFLLAASPLTAAPSIIVTLNNVADRVRAENPDLAAARLQIDEAVGRRKQAGRLANPELETSFEHNPRFREGKVEVGIARRFPLTQRLRLEKAVSATQVQAAEAEVRNVERKLIAEAREAVVNVLAIRQRRELLKSQANVSRDFATFLDDVAKKGEGSSLDAGLAKLEAATLNTELSQLDAEETTTIGILKPLLGLRPNTSINISGTLAEPSLPSSDTNPGRRPDLQAATLDAKAAGQAVALEQSRRYEDVEAAVFAGAERSEDAPEGYDNEAVLGVRLKIPLPFWNKNEGAIQEAQATQTRKQKEATALARSIRLDAETARQEMQQWAKLVTEFRTSLIPLAEEQSSFAESSYRNGQAEIQTVFRSREKRLQVAAARIDALRQFHLARVRYEAALAIP